MVARTQVCAMSVGVVVVSLAVLTGCSNVQKSSPQLSHSPEQRVAESKKTAAEKAKMIADLQKQKKLEAKRTVEAKAKISTLLAQSDAAFRTAQGYKNLAAKEKNPIKKQQMLGYVKKAQTQADELAQQLLDMHATMYDAASKSKAIDGRISALTAEKKRAEQIALGGKEPAKKL